METFCPLCAKSGVKRRLKAFQINLEDAVWACEAEEVNNFLVPFLNISFISVLTVLFIFQCTWPIGYEELTFFNRTAASCNWEEEMNSAKEDMPALMELSLYTPPVTPGGELSKELIEIASTEYSSNPLIEDKIETLPQSDYIGAKESSWSNKLSLFESLELGSISSNEENRSVMNEQIRDVNIFRTLPKITNIQKTNINVKIFSNTGEHYDDKKIQEHSLTFDTTVMDTFKNFNVSDSACTEFGFSTQNEIEDKQSENHKLQSDATVSDVETNFGVETTKKTLVNIDVTKSLNATNESIENISEIDTLLTDILNESHIPVDINEDWLNLLMS